MSEDSDAPDEVDQNDPERVDATAPEEDTPDEDTPDKADATAPEKGAFDEADPESTATGDGESAGAASSHGASGGPMEPEAAIALDADRELWIPPDASEVETAAIAAAVAAYLTDRERARESDEEDWAGDRWRFAGRLDALGRGTERVPTDAPRDPWTASGRADRF